jgi:hypothetical protein
MTDERVSHRNHAILLRVTEARHALRKDRYVGRADAILAAFERELGGLGLQPFPVFRRKPSRLPNRQVVLCVGVNHEGEPCPNVALVGDLCRRCANNLKARTRICPECGRKPPGPLPAALAADLAAESFEEHG